MCAQVEDHSFGVFLIRNIESNMTNDCRNYRAPNHRALFPYSDSDANTSYTETLTSQIIMITLCMLYVY